MIEDLAHEMTKSILVLHEYTKHDELLWRNKLEEYITEKLKEAFPNER